MNRPVALALLVLLAALSAGCLDAASPVGEAEAAHAGTSCDLGMFVSGFAADGSPTCTAPAPVATACERGHVMIGIAADGAAKCSPIMDVAQEAMEDEQAQRQQEPARPTKSLSITANGALKDGVKSYTIAAASPGMNWSALHFTLDGTTLVQAAACTPDVGQYAACSDGAREAESATVDAGDHLVVAASSGSTLRVIDAHANAVILSVRVG